MQSAADGSFSLQLSYRCKQRVPSYTPDPLTRCCRSTEQTVSLASGTVCPRDCCTDPSLDHCESHLCFCFFWY